ncbi:hypothetical protein ACFV23_27255, partial [Streptomyces sp. NPDC059627]
MKISVSSDMDEPVARLLVEELRRRGHEVRTYGALEPGADPQWAVCSEAGAPRRAAPAAPPPGGGGGTGPRAPPPAPH